MVDYNNYYYNPNISDENQLTGDFARDYDIWANATTNVMMSYEERNAIREQFFKLHPNP